jgi:glycosyltransferase involved in cell wall biosynthesis
VKILLVAHFFPPNRAEGAEKRALGYATTLQKQGHDVQILCAGDWERGRKQWNGFTDEMYQNVPVRRVNLNWTKAQDPNRSLYDISLVEENLSNWMEEWKPDIVHIISLITLGVGVVRAAERFGVPVLFTLTDFWMVCPKNSLVKGDGSLCDGHTTEKECLRCLLWNSKVYKIFDALLSDSSCESIFAWISQRPWLNRQRGLRGMALDMAERRRVIADIAPKFDRVIAPSTNLARIIDEFKIFPEPVQVIYSGHDLSWLESMIIAEPRSMIRFGFIGQLIPAKGLAILIQAFQLATKEKKACLLVYGNLTKNPEYVDSLQAAILPDDEIHFKGVFQHEQLGVVLAGIDVLVVPSQWHENNPRVIQEAFAARVPVIASDVGGISEFVEHDVNGLLFEHDSAEELRKQIERILIEPGLIDRLKNGIQQVKTIEEEVSEIIDCYQALVSVRNEAAA